MAEHVPVKVWSLETGEEITGQTGDDVLLQLGRFVASGGSLAGVPLVARIVMSNGDVVEIETYFEATSTIRLERDTVIERVEFHVNGHLICWESQALAVRAGNFFSITPRLQIS